jgi:hypothetical protein
VLDTYSLASEAKLLVLLLGVGDLRAQVVVLSLQLTKLIQKRRQRSVINSQKDFAVFVGRAQRAFGWRRFRIYKTGRGTLTSPIEKCTRLSD